MRRSGSCSTWRTVANMDGSNTGVGPLAEGGFFFEKYNRAATQMATMSNVNMDWPLVWTVVSAETSDAV